MLTQIKTQIEGLPGCDWLPRELMAWRPRERINPVGWMEKYRVLTGLSEEKGPMRIIRTPFFGPVLNWAVDPETDEIVVCKPAQIGGTENFVSLIGFFVHQERCPVLLVMADEATSEHMARHRIQTMVDGVPELAAMKGDPWNAKEMKLLNGGFVAVAWASSVAGLGSREYRVVVFDEVDKPGYSVTTKEASPLSLGRERTATFWNRKHLLLSTPTLESGNIWQELNSCDVIFDWFVPCPYCGKRQPLRFSREYATGFKDGFFVDEHGKRVLCGQVVWEGGLEASTDQVNRAGYECAYCQRVFNTFQKNKAVEQGVYVARDGKAPAVQKKKGVHLNRLYSLLGTSGDFPVIVDNWIRVLKSGDPRLLQGFINSTLADIWKTYTGERDDSALLELADDRPEGAVPGGGVVAALLMGIDTQDNGFWYEIRAFGWGMTEDSWQVRYGFVDSFEALEVLLFQSEYFDPDGNPYRVKKAAIDTGGHRAAEVLEWCRKHRGMVIPIKGTDRQAAHIAWRAQEFYPGTNKAIPGGLRRMDIDVNYYKDKLASKLAIAESDPGAWRFCADVSKEWINQMTAEVIDEKTGRWVPKYESRPNHALDVSAYLLALADVMFVKNWAKPKQEKQQNPPDAAQRASGGGWIGRGGPGWINRG